MSKFLKRMRWVVALVLLGALAITAAVMAEDIPWGFSSEPDTVLPAEGEPIDLSSEPDSLDGMLVEVAPPAWEGEPSADGELTEGAGLWTTDQLQPDQNGYEGPVPQQEEAEMQPSAMDEALPQTTWGELASEPQPDDEAAGIAGTETDPNWSGFYYYYAAGSVLKPRDSSVNWASDGSGGCVYLSSGNANVIVNLPLDLPNGVRIDYLRLYYYDTSAGTSYAWVTRYDGQGGMTDITNVASTGNSGYGTSLSALVEHVVNGEDYSYVLNWRPTVIGNTMQLCGLRVAYRLP